MNELDQVKEALRYGKEETLGLKLKGGFDCMTLVEHIESLCSIAAGWQKGDSELWDLKHNGRYSVDWDRQAKMSQSGEGILKICTRSE